MKKLRKLQVQVAKEFLGQHRIIRQEIVARNFVSR